jgi:hypothetical protein
MADTELRADSALSNTASSADAKRWDELVSRWQAVEAVPSASLPDGVDPDALINLAGDLIGEIMAMPAPHADAVKWKLDWIVGTPNGSESYEADYVAQLVADYRRFLGGAAEMPEGSAKIFPQLNKLALEVQEHCGLISSLAAAIDDASDNLANQNDLIGENTMHTRAAVNIIRFARLIEERSEKAADIAEDIERQSMLLSCAKQEGR